MRIVVEPNHQLAKQHPASSQDIMQANMPNMFEDVLALTNVFDRVKSGKLLFRTLVRFTICSIDGEEKRRSRRVAAREAGKMVLLVNKPGEQSVPGPAADFPMFDEMKTRSNPETPTSMSETPHEYRGSSLARNTVIGVEHELQLASTLTNSDIERLILLEKLTEARLRRQIAERDLA
ncbi:hypothetical protein Q9L58_006662 [Maublancomyces gigas]|uniref:Uncharacterized protein n=1 Tax=Discina gigas TaxID=1032678 RepID=A0ABR3GER5_9PEZI